MVSRWHGCVRRDVAVAFHAMLLHRARYLMELQRATALRPHSTRPMPPSTALRFTPCALHPAQFLHSRLYILHLTPHTLRYPLCAVHSAYYTEHFTLRTLQSTLYIPHSPSRAARPTLYTQHVTFFVPRSAFYTALQLHALHSARYTAHLTLYAPRPTLYIPPFVV